MATKAQMTGMRGVFLVAAELSKLGFIVSLTSRSAVGADLLITDQQCCKAWSVQVKTNKSPANFWLVNSHAAQMKSESHVYVFVNIGKSERPEYLVVPSYHVASNVCHEVINGGSWYSFARADRLYDDEGWHLFGDPHPVEVTTAASTTDLEPISAAHEESPHIEEVG